MPIIIPSERIEKSIYLVRGQKVILDRDLAAIYGVLTFRFNEAVRRNMKRFPEDFMFQLTHEELEILISHNALSKPGRRGTRTLMEPPEKPGNKIGFEIKDPKAGYGKKAKRKDFLKKIVKI